MFKKIIHSMIKNRLGIALIISAAFVTACGQLLWKCSQYFLDIYFLTGFILYFCGAALMIIAFKFGDLSILHPLLSFGYIFSIFLGGIFLGESLTGIQITGIAVIILGATLIGGGDDD